MILPFPIDSALVTASINNTKALLAGNESILFDSMHAVHPAFALPINPSQFAAKNREIDVILARIAFGGGIDVNFKLIDEILDQVIIHAININIDDLVNRWQFEIQPECILCLTNNQQWLYKRQIIIRHLHHDLSIDHILTIRDRNYGVVVPDYIIQYFHTALNCFSQHLYPVCLALSSIIIEGTLKDVLTTRGYTFDYANRRATNYVGGLGTALNKARNVEGFLTPTDLPSDLDSVIQPIRNNLVHLSGNAFNTRLPYLDGHNGIPNFVLKNFVDDPLLVYDLIQSVSAFVEKMYMDLRAVGHLHT